MSAEESLKYGIIDEIIGSNKTDSMSKWLDGFDEYYKKEVINKI